MKYRVTFKDGRKEIIEACTFDLDYSEEDILICFIKLHGREIYKIRDISVIEDCSDIKE